MFQLSLVVYDEVTGKFGEIEAVAVDAGYKTPWIAHRLDHNDQHAGGQRIEQRVCKIGGYLVRFPRLDIVFGMETGGEFKKVSIKNFARCGEGHQNDPPDQDKRKDDPCGDDQVAGQQRKFFFKIKRLRLFFSLAIFQHSFH